MTRFTNVRAHAKRYLLAATVLTGLPALAMAGEGAQTEGFPRRSELVSPQAQLPTGGSAQSGYYCAKPNGYYPAVKNCLSGWQLVPNRPGS